MPETILQFGAGKFLRCFLDLLVSQQDAADLPIGRIVVLQSTGTARADQFNRQQGRFHAATRGLCDGVTIDRVEEVTSVSRALAAPRDWAEVCRLALSPELQAVISNVTEAGYGLDAADRPDDAPPRSFPAKLLALLRLRCQHSLPGLAILPCELLQHNATRLRGLLAQQAAAWQMPEAETQRVIQSCSWHDTLVDRIVSAPAPGDPLAAADPLYAVAEPFALWAITGRPSLPGLLQMPAVNVVDDLQPFYLRKVRILNGAHTALVARAMPQGFVTVRQAVNDPEINAWLRRLLFEEIVPLLEGRTECPQRFAQQTLERFANPFLEHRLADIALHHETKLTTRLLPSLLDYRQRFNRTPPLLSELVGHLPSG